jgi:hypothetical protein
MSSEKIINTQDEKLTQVKNLAETNESEVKRLCMAYLAFSQKFLFPIPMESFARNSGFAESLLYIKPNNQPKIKVLRHLSQYLDGNIGIQDEISFQDRATRFQFNFEINNVGHIIKHPSKYDNMKEFIDKYNSATTVNGNTIWCNFVPQGCYTSLNGEWVKTEKYQSKLLETSKNQINPDSLSQLPSRS